MVPFGRVIFAKTISTARLSVTLAAISITSETLNVLLLIGNKSNTLGIVTSFMEIVSFVVKVPKPVLLQVTSQSKIPVELNVLL